MSKDNVIIGNGNEIIVSPECADIMESEGLIYHCTEDHPDDAHYFHTEEKLREVAF